MASKHDPDLRHAETCVGEFVRSHLENHEPAALAVGLVDAALKITLACALEAGIDPKVAFNSLNNVIQTRWNDLVVQVAAVPTGAKVH